LPVDVRRRRKAGVGIGGNNCCCSVARPVTVRRLPQTFYLQAIAWWSFLFLREHARGDAVYASGTSSVHASPCCVHETGSLSIFLFYAYSISFINYVHICTCIRLQKAFRLCCTPATGCLLSPPGMRDLLLTYSYALPLPSVAILTCTAGDSIARA